VIGPEKLPRVARTVGTLLGKAQRYVADVKNEVNRSMELDELKKMKETMESAARDVQGSVQSTANDFEQSWNQATASLEQAGHASRCSCHGGFSRIQASRQEMAHQARRHAPMVQSARRCAHAGAVRGCAGGPFSAPFLNA